MVWGIQGDENGFSEQSVVKDLAGGVLLLLVAAGYAALAGGINPSALDDGVGAAGIPFIYAALVAALGLALAARAAAARWFDRAAPRLAGVEGRRLLGAAGMLGIGVAYVAVVTFLGYPLALAGVLAGAALYQGARPRPAARPDRVGRRRGVLALLRRHPAARHAVRILAGALGRMMETVVDGLGLLVTTPIALAAAGGVAWGILGGALPGISPSISMALLLPFTYGMEPHSAIVLLAATYVGAEYGGSIPAILIHTPGTNAAAATLLDGHPMKLQGRGGEALGISLYSGVIGGFVGLLMLMALTRPLAELALRFTPMSYFALGVLGLGVIASLAGPSLLKGLAAGLLGLMVATVGADPVSGGSPLHLRTARPARRRRADPSHGGPVRRQRAVSPGWKSAP